jgi:CHAD domain-containing protein
MSNRQGLGTSRIAMLSHPADRLATELRKILEHSGDVDAVHDARVAARRLLAAGELWAAPVTPWAQVRDRLPRLVRKLGRVRNLDVAIELLRKGPREEEASRKALARQLRKARKKERARLEDWLSRKRVDRLDKAMGKVVREVQLRPVLDAPSPSDLSPHVARILSLFAGRAWAPTAEEAHAIRREVRRLRYAHETLQWAYTPEDFQPVVKTLQKIQELAGEWQDRCVLEELAGKAIRKGRVSVPLTAFLARIQSESRSLATRFVQAAAELAELRARILGEPA